MIAVPMLVAAVAAVIYLLVDPQSAGLVAETFRADHFADAGFSAWTDAWYGGQSLPGLGLLSSPLGSLLTPQLVGALSAVGAAGLFAAIGGPPERRRGARAGAVWFAAATVVPLALGQITLMLGTALGLAAVLAIRRRRPMYGAALAGLTALASPACGVVLAAVALGAVLAARRRARSRRAAWLVPAIVGGAAAVASAPFLIWFPVEAAAASAVVLGTLLAGPVLALVLARSHPAVLVALALPLAGLQVYFLAAIRGDDGSARAAERSFYLPLADELGTLTAGGPVRVEVVPTADRWEAVHIARRYPIAQGALPAAEDDAGLFEDGGLDEGSYLEWLRERGVGYVALPRGVELAERGEDEAGLVEAGLPYLRKAWETADWALYVVTDDGAALVAGAGGEAASDARLAELGDEAFELTADAPGTYLVRVRFTPYWRVVEGDACVARDGDWTRVEVSAPSVTRVEARFEVGARFRDGDC